jgi:hypothetical protein
MRPRKLLLHVDLRVAIGLRSPAIDVAELGHLLIAEAELRAPFEQRCD